MNGEQKNPKRKYLIGLGLIIAVIGPWYLISFVKNLATPCGSNTLDCKGEHAKMLLQFSNIRSFAYQQSKAGYPLKGICNSSEVKKYLDKIPSKYNVDCKDSDSGFTLIAKRDGAGTLCLDSKTWTSTTTSSEIQEGVACR